MTNKLLSKLSKLYNEIHSEVPYKTKTVSFLIYKNKIISFGVNSEKTSPLQFYCRIKSDVVQNNYISDKIHSEIDCIKKTTNFTKWKKAELVVISKRKDGKFRLARPCKICTTLINQKGIRKIWYSTNENTFILENFIKEF